MFTRDCAEAWIDEHRKQCLEELAECDEIPKVLISLPIFQQIFFASEWMHAELKQLSANIDDIRRMKFALGQRSVIDDPVDIACEYLNAFVRMRGIPEMPGKALAEQIFAKMSTEESYADDSRI